MNKEVLATIFREKKHKHSEPIKTIPPSEPSQSIEGDPEEAKSTGEAVKSFA